MNPWLGKSLLLAGLVASVVIRWPHDARSGKVRIAESRRGPLEVGLLALMTIATMLLPIVFIATPLLSFADYPLRAVPLALGAAVMAGALWLFYRSHADLGTNWSMTLQVREKHSLVTAGVYRYIRHPMYAALFGYAIGQALLLANWVAGPACFLAFLLMFLLRLGPEEAMMRDTFGGEYQAYASQTKRLIPGVW
jgi:protein-S-isoprenylcysteine O-methyltransferase Ste14